MRTVLIMNPSAGVSPLAAPRETPELNEQTLLEVLHIYDIEPEVWHTTLEDPGEGLARRAADEHVDLVITAGGDGTIHSVASGLINRESTLGIIPMGTMNNLAHSLGIPLTPEEACAVIAKGKTRAIDVGQINEQTFLEVAGIGFEAALFPAAEEIKKSGLISTLRGVITGLFKVFTYKPGKIKVSIHDRRIHSYDALQLTICNAPFYGPHFHISPDILMDDGKLDVFIFRNFSKLEYIKHAISISQGRREFQPKLKHLRVKSLQIRTDEPLEIQADGMPHGHTPAKVKVVAGALHIRVPTTDVPALREDSIEEANSRLQSSRR